MLQRIEKGKMLREYTKGAVIRGGGHMSLLRGYKYVLEHEPGTNMDPSFTPALTPAEMLFMGVFEGKYLNDCTNEFPQEWYRAAYAAGKLSLKSDVSCNYFGVPSRQPLHVWRTNGWVPGGSHREKGKRAILADPVRNPDERGWFQWYCRYWLGRRIPDLDAVQIGRWRSFARHVGAIRKGCSKGDLQCRVRERQALLQWAYDPFV